MADKYCRRARLYLEDLEPFLSRPRRGRSQYAHRQALRPNNGAIRFLFNVTLLDARLARLDQGNLSSTNDARAI